jgi:hypothetical protein
LLIRMTVNRYSYIFEQYRSRAVCKIRKVTFK